MSGIVPKTASVSELLELARRVRKHAHDFATHQVGASLSAFADELEARAEALMTGGSGGGGAEPEQPV